MAKRLKRPFFAKPALWAAQAMLGKYIIRKIGNRKKGQGTLIGKIVETEAYIGPEDKASHAFGGKKTPRNRAEYLAGGHIYIYLVYGMYWQFNISTGKEGSPECVLIRALEPVAKDAYTNMSEYQANISESKIIRLNSRGSKISLNSLKLTNGPGKLCRWLKLNKSFYGEDVTRSKRIWLTHGVKVKKSQIASGPRINIDYAGPIWAKKPWRFYIKDNPYVSKR